MLRSSLAIAAGALGLLLATASMAAEDKSIDRDWRTGVAVAPGATTWTSDNYANKKNLINDVASSQSKTCSDNYAFIGWGAAHGGPSVIVPQTRQNYEKAGYKVDARKGGIETETIWIVRSPEREAVILWGDALGSTIYLSCLTKGTATGTAETPFYLGIFSALAVAGLIAGWWLLRRMRAPNKPA